MQVWADEVWQRLCDPLQGSDGAQQVDLVGQKLLPVLERVQYGWHQPAETNASADWRAASPPCRVRVKDGHDRPG